MTKEDIFYNQNENGGGLAKNITGLHESNRNALAKLDENKRTAGQVAKSLRKKGLKIYAKDIKPLMEEWHHAGMLSKNYGGGMAKAYYTLKSDEQIVSEFNELKAEIKKKENTLLTGFYWVWDHDYNGRYGKKQNFKVCKWFEGSELEQPKNFVACEKLEFDNSNLYDGKKFYGWDEPTL